LAPSTAWPCPTKFNPPPPIVDEDLLFGAAFDAIRRGTSKEETSTRYTAKPGDDLNSTVASGSLVIVTPGVSELEDLASAI
uniref:UDP-N-acetylmuramoyl-L-alanyl-D-glutamate--2, 6-diaminopimelate ligase n=1 Tax=Echinostoma caproni TaxID=27848 RepID=A0A183A7M4_9TREM